MTGVRPPASRELSNDVPTENPPTEDYWADSPEAGSDSDQKPARKKSEVLS